MIVSIGNWYKVLNQVPMSSLLSYLDSTQLKKIHVFLYYNGGNAVHQTV